MAQITQRMHAIWNHINKVKSSKSIMFDLASYKSQLLAFVNSMPMLDMCHLRLHKVTAINSHHVLAPPTFE